MRKAWRCNPWPAAFVTVVAETEEAAELLARKRMGAEGAEMECSVLRIPEFDKIAEEQSEDLVLWVEEY